MLQIGGFESIFKQGENVWLEGNCRDDDIDGARYSVQVPSIILSYPPLLYYMLEILLGLSNTVSTTVCPASLQLHRPSL